MMPDNDDEHPSGYLIQVPADHTFATWPTTDRMLTARIRALITEHDTRD